MRTLTQSDLKSDHLRKSATLNPHPEQVKDALFQSHPFFDPRDLVQIKYEMLRRVMIDGQTVEAAAAAFGFSRVRWYLSTAPTLYKPGAGRAAASEQRTPAGVQVVQRGFGCQCGCFRITRA
jgi:hypothetical protein